MIAAFQPDAAGSIGQKSLWLMIESNKIKNYIPIGRMMQLKIDKMVVMVQINPCMSIPTINTIQVNWPPTGNNCKGEDPKTPTSPRSIPQQVASGSRDWITYYPIDKRFYRRDSWFGLMSSSLSSWSSVPSWRCSSSSISFLTRSAILVKVLSRVMGVSGTKSCSQQQDTFQISTSWISDFQDKSTGLLVGLRFSMSKALVCQLKHFLWNDVKAPSTWYLYF